MTMQDGKKCSFIKPDNEQCNAWAMTDYSFCFTHNPDTQMEREVANQRGGQANKITVMQPLPALELDKPNDVVEMLKDTVNQVRAGTMDLKVANTMGYLAGHLIKAMEVAKIESRVETIERVLIERRTTAIKKH